MQSFWKNFLKKQIWETDKKIEVLMIYFKNFVHGGKLAFFVSLFSSEFCKTTTKIMGVGIINKKKRVGKFQINVQNIHNFWFLTWFDDSFL